MLVTRRLDARRWVDFHGTQWSVQTRMLLVILHWINHHIGIDGFNISASYPIRMYPRHMTVRRDQSRCRYKVWRCRDGRDRDWMTRTSEEVYEAEIWYVNVRHITTLRRKIVWFKDRDSSDSHCLWDRMLKFSSSAIEHIYTGLCWQWCSTIRIMSLEPLATTPMPPMCPLCASYVPVYGIWKLDSFKLIGCWATLDHCSSALPWLTSAESCRSNRW